MFFQRAVVNESIRKHHTICEKEDFQAPDARKLMQDIGGCQELAPDDLCIVLCADPGSTYSFLITKLYKWLANDKITRLE